MDLVGKKVQLITDNPRFGLGAVRKGDIGIVTQVVTDPYDTKELVIRFPAHSSWNGVMSDIKLIEPSSNKEATSVMKLLDKNY